MTNFAYDALIEKAKAKLLVDIKLYKLQPLPYRIKHWPEQAIRKYRYNRLLKE